MISTRRTFLAAAGAWAAGSTARGAGRALRLGGPIFQKSDDPRELAREHRRLGYSAAYCPDSKVEDTARNRAARGPGLRWLGRVGPGDLLRPQPENHARHGGPYVPTEALH